MRYFIAKNGENIVDKQAVSGEDEKIDVLVTQYKASHPGFVVTELDQATFESTSITLVQTQAQKDWVTFKAQVPTPTALQGILYLARYLGLE